MTQQDKERKEAEGEAEVASINTLWYAWFFSFMLVNISSLPSKGSKRLARFPPQNSSLSLSLSLKSLYSSSSSSSMYIHPPSLSLILLEAGGVRVQPPIQGEEHDNTYISHA